MELKDLEGKYLLIVFGQGENRMFAGSFVVNEKGIQGHWHADILDAQPFATREVAREVKAMLEVAWSRTGSPIRYEIVRVKNGQIEHRINGGDKKRWGAETAKYMQDVRQALAKARS